MFWSSIMTSSSHQWWLSFVIRWRVVKSCEEWATTLHLSQPLCLSGFQANLWRVKSIFERYLIIYIAIRDTRLTHRIGTRTGYHSHQWCEGALGRRILVSVEYRWGNKVGYVTEIASGTSSQPKLQSLSHFPCEGGVDIGIGVIMTKILVLSHIFEMHVEQREARLLAMQGQPSQYAWWNSC